MNWFQQLFSIKDGTDYSNTSIAISNGIHIKGTNVWLMICSVLLACIGLDTNSTAVIIGAMLISPLMSPILGIGYSVGVHDRELFIRAARNLAYVTFFSLLTAFIYFKLTPLGEPTSEIMARTKPTLLDIGVAFFGGVAGIVSGSRKDKTNALPGVAIATALMPPLCAAGFGLATARWEVFGGAFYLFFINAVFISLSTYLIVKLLRFPFKSYVDKAKEKRMARSAMAMLILISAPSIWFLYGVYQSNKTLRVIQQEVIEDFHLRGNEILKWETEHKDTVTLVKTFYSGQPVSDNDLGYYNHKLADLGLKLYRIEFFRMNMSRNEMDKLSTEMTANIMKAIELQNNRLRDSLQLYQRSGWDEQVIYDEVKAFFPGLAAIGVGPLYIKSAAKSDTLWTAIVQWDSTAALSDQQNAEKSISDYLKKRLNTDSVWFRNTPKPASKK